MMREVLLFYLALALLCVVIGVVIYHSGRLLCRLGLHDWAGLRWHPHIVCQRCGVARK